MKIVLLCIFTFLFYTLLTEFTLENSTVSIDEKPAIEEVNNILTKEKIEARPLETNIIKKDNIIDKDIINKDLEFDQDEDLGEVQNSLDQAFLRTMANRQLSIENAKEYKKEFIREYLRKAKQAGYDIVLNNKLQVIRITKRKTYEPVLIDVFTDEE